MSYFLAALASSSVLVTIFPVMIPLAQWADQWLAISVKKKDCVAAAVRFQWRGLRSC